MKKYKNLAEMAKRREFAQIAEVIKHPDEYCFDINGCDENNLTAYMHAVLDGNFKLADSLQKAGANINIGDPLNLVISRRLEHLAIFLLERGAVIRGNDICAAVNTKALNIVNAMIDAGVNVNLRDSSGYTALWYAKSNGDSEMEKILLQSNARI